MANQGQLELLKKSVEEWDKWREENPDEVIGLIGANLFETDLIGEIHRSRTIGGMAKRKFILSKAEQKELLRAYHGRFGECGSEAVWSEIPKPKFLFASFAKMWF